MSTTHKWLLRIALTAVGVLLTTDRRRSSPPPIPPPKKPAS
ncbi:hypothetical protein [Hymenobacter saemangeumensis]